MEDRALILSKPKQKQRQSAVIDHNQTNRLTTVLYDCFRVEAFKNRLAKEPGTGRRSVHVLLSTDDI